MIQFIMQARNGDEIFLDYDAAENRLAVDGKELRIQKGVAPHKERGLTLRLALGKACNMQCSYCKQTKKDFGDGMPDTELVTEILRFTGERRIGTVQFWGGEPLLYFDRIRNLYSLFKARNMVDHYFISTNGVLLYGERLQWLLDTPDVSVAISWDGPGQGLRGKDVFADARVRDAVRRLLVERPEQACLSPVMSKGNAVYTGYVEAARAALGIDTFRVGVAPPIMVADDAGFNAAVSETDLPEYRRRFYNDLMRDKITNCDMFNMSISAFLVRLGEPIFGIPQCNITNKNCLNVDVAGNILTCQTYTAEDVDESGEPHCMGHIRDLHAGETPPIPQASRLLQRQKDKCRACPVAALCRGGCPYTPEKYVEYTCKENYNHYLPLLGRALYFLTGDVLREVRTKAA